MISESRKCRKCNLGGDCKTSKITKKVKFRDFPVFEGTCTKGVFEKLCVQWVNLEVTKVGCGEKNAFSIC